MAQISVASTTIMKKVIPKICIVSYLRIRLVLRNIRRKEHFLGDHLLRLSYILTRSDSLKEVDSNAPPYPVTNGKRQLA